MYAIKFLLPKATEISKIVLENDQSWRTRTLECIKKCTLCKLAGMRGFNNVDGDHWFTVIV